MSFSRNNTELACLSEEAGECIMEGAESADPLVPSTIHPRNSRMPSKVQPTLRLSKLPSSSTNFADQAEVGIPHSCEHSHFVLGTTLYNCVGV